tara:strand:- start:237 stop:473 length:237 start_codon:yes stop_codon:yes gene_type:complete
MIFRCAAARFMCAVQRILPFWALSTVFGFEALKNVLCCVHEEILDESVKTEKWPCKVADFRDFGCCFTAWDRWAPWRD